MSIAAPVPTRVEEPPAADRSTAEPEPNGRESAGTEGEGRRPLVAAGLAASALVLAVVAVDPGGLHPFTTLRWPAVAAAVLVAAVVAWPARTRLPRSLQVAAAAFAGWMLVATLLAVDPVSAWLGHPQRHLGLVAWAVAGAGFVVGAALRDQRARRILGRGAVMAAGLLGVGALVELLGVDVVTASGFGDRLGGTFGQPAYLGAAGVLLAPVAVGAGRSERGPWRWVAWTSAALAGAAVVGSQTRGAWLGLVVAAVVAIPLLGAPAVARRRAAWVVAAVAVVVVGLAVLTPLGARVTSLADVDGGTVRGRLDEWRVAAATVADRPWFGAGPEGYRVVVTEHLDDDYSRRYGRDVGVDRAHDGVLDVAAVGGVPAALALLVAVGSVLVRIPRARRDRDPVVVGAAAAVAGYAVQQLVLFPIAELDPLAWLLAGVVVAATATAPPRAPAKGSAALGRVAAVVVLAGAVALAALGAVDGSADRLLADAVARGRDGDHLGALAAADAAAARRPSSIDAWYVAAEIAAQGPGLLDVDAALDRVEAGLARSPDDPPLLDLRERLLVARARRSGLPEDRDRSRAASEARLAVDPSNPAHHRALGLVLAAAGDDAGASTALGRAIELDPDDEVAAAALDQLGTGSG